MIPMDVRGHFFVENLGAKAHTTQIVTIVLPRESLSPDALVSQIHTQDLSGIATGVACVHRFFLPRWALVLKRIHASPVSTDAPTASAAGVAPWSAMPGRPF